MSRRPRPRARERLLGTEARLRGVDDELLIGVGVGGKRIPFEFALDRPQVGCRSVCPAVHGNVCSAPLRAELLVSDRDVANEFGMARLVGR
jgi:hypothetical protein